MNSWFVSDIHLKDLHERNGNTLLRFLFYLNENPKEHRLFLLGDIFDAWVSGGSAFVNHFSLLINEIAKFKHGGGEVYYFEGNHDVHIDVFWTKKFGIPVIEEMQYFDLHGLTLRLEHGDFINSEDKAYRQYRDLVHRPWVELLAHKLPSQFWKWLTESQSMKSRKKTSRYALENSERIIKLVRTYAEKTFNEKPFDLIVTGHMHIFDDYTFTVNGRNVRSINLGTWLETPLALKVSDAKIEIIFLEPFLKIVGVTENSGNP